MKTIQNYFSSISAFYSFLIEERAAKVNPVDQFRIRYLRVYKEDREERQIVEIEQLETILDNLSGGDQAACLLLAKSGMRRTECLETNVGDFDFARGMLFLPKRDNARKRSNRRIPLDEQTIEILQAYWQDRADRGEVMTRESPAFVTETGCRIWGERLRVRLQRAAVKAGVHDPAGPLCKRFSPHCFRHWFTTTMLAEGMAPAYVDEIRGDKRHGSREVYNHISDKRLVDEFRRFMPKIAYRAHFDKK